jgi:hypothetical protein
VIIASTIASSADRTLIPMTAAVPSAAKASVPRLCIA